MSEAKELSYTERKFFKMPIKVYDLYSVMNTEAEEDKLAKKSGGMIEALPLEYIQAEKACIPEDIIGYVQGSNKGEKLEDIEKEGFKCTIVVIREVNEINVYECLWDIDEFTNRLNKRMKQ